MSVKDDMPIIASNEGVWEGWYRYYNLDGDKTDEHRSRLLCRFLDEETYHQTNYYFWEDGTRFFDREKGAVRFLFSDGREIPFSNENEAAVRQALVSFCATTTGVEDFEEFAFVDGKMVGLCIAPSQ